MVTYSSCSYSRQISFVTEPKPRFYLSSDALSNQVLHVCGSYYYKFLVGTLHCVDYTRPFLYTQLTDRRIIHDVHMLQRQNVVCMPTSAVSSGLE